MMKVIKLLKGDITTLQVDAMVNAANSSLMGGGGVDGAIHRRGGKQILEECIAIRNRQGKCRVGEAVYTSGGLLSCRYVIHTVGPIWNGGNHNEAQLLANCYQNALRIAESLQVKTIAFPNISTGVYHFPKAEAATIAVENVKLFLQKTDIEFVKEVIFVCFENDNFELYEKLI
jgi:O-acetyl-ADP-ribose deacetylase (regulator of RNase III)